jgi:hypothetical protein
LVLKTPEPFSEAPSTTAPAASPKSMQVPRSFQLLAGGIALSAGLYLFGLWRART